MTPTPITKPNPANTALCDTPFPAANQEVVKKKILVLDDDPGIRESLHKVLRAEGYDVVLAMDGWDGIAKFNTERMDLLLLDVSLPDISGWEVFGMLTSINPFVPIIIITGKDAQRDLALLGGAGALFEKPLDVSQLLETMKKLLAEPAEVHLQRLAGCRRDLRYAGRRAGGAA